MIFTEGLGYTEECSCNGLLYNIEVSAHDKSFTKNLQDLDIYSMESYSEIPMLLLGAICAAARDSARRPIRVIVYSWESEFGAFESREVKNSLVDHIISA